ncbi:aminotransferase class IV [Brevundimonas denitrificans]|uniref:aminotransferase class IV n=1 Tax=Brevundimonas denitrificans TaxID=1443434 RepID=UPI00223A8FE4|nr:aminotransferase class IV [Brevundimonas denitrificans]
MATFGLIRERREAMAAGDDDVLFADDNGRVTEGSIWNIGFLKGDTVVWPQGPMLAGTGQALIQRGLEAVDVATEQRWVGLPELPDFDAAFIVNAAMIGVPVAAIGGGALCRAAGPDHAGEERLAIKPVSAALGSTARGC